MSVNKIKLLQNFIETKIYFKRQRYEELRFSKPREVKDYYWQLDSYKFESFHPFAPLFLESFKDCSFNQDFILCIDNPLDIYFLLQKLDPRYFSPILILNRSLASIVPAHWLKNIIYFDISVTKERYLEDKKNLIVHGQVNKTSIKDQSLLDNVFNI